MENEVIIQAAELEVKRIDFGAVLISQIPALSRCPLTFQKALISVLRKLVNAERIDHFLYKNRSVEGFDFIEKIFKELGVNSVIKKGNIENIPADGRVLIVANHPLGGLDGLALLRLVGRVRCDVNIVVNELLLNITNLKNMSLPINALSGDVKKDDIKRIIGSLNNNEAVVIFPAGEVSRAGLMGVHDREWFSGFIHLAKATKSPILPIHIKARNSKLFYVVSKISQLLSMLMLPREMLGFKGQINFTIGELIAPPLIQNMPFSCKRQARLVSDDLRCLAAGKSSLSSTQTSIIHPQNRKAICAELKDAQVLGKTSDRKIILLYDYNGKKVVMDEIGRLRESAFRAVGGGTGHCKDLDHYDRYYRHLILWDDSNLEIVGAYRLGEIWRWPKHSNRLLYSNSLFNYHASSQFVLARGLELGRSFVQPRYWGKKGGLDYLWQGIGAYIACHPEVKYLFGPVSLSPNLPKKALDMLAYYYGNYFPDPDSLVSAKNSYDICADLSRVPVNNFTQTEQSTALCWLKSELDLMGLKIPTLYKQYSGITTSGGTRFCAFNIDKNFGGCVDGLVCVDIARLKPKKRERYVRLHKT